MRFVCRYCKLTFDVEPETASLIVDMQCPIMVKGINHSLFGELPWPLSAPVPAQICEKCWGARNPGPYKPVKICRCDEE